MADGDVLKIVSGHQAFAPGGGGGGGVTVDNTVDPPFTAATFIAAGATEDPAGTAVLPLATVSDTDPGAIGTNRLWLRTNDQGFVAQLYVRDDTNTSWVEVAIAHYDDDDHLRGYVQLNDDGYDISYKNTGGTIRGYVRHTPSGAAHRWRDDAGISLAELNLTTTDGTRGAMVIGTEQGTAMYFLGGADDPSAGAGIACPAQGIYGRDVNGDGATLEYWFKTGAADTAWTKLTLP